MNGNTSISENDPLIQRYLFPDDDFFEYSKLGVDTNQTLYGERVFKVAHQVLVEQWQPAIDYQLGVIEGYCNYCCTVEEGLKLNTIVTQVGAVRHGLKVGLCFGCVHGALQSGEENAVQLLKNNQPYTKLEGEELSIQCSFEGSKDRHRIDITVDRLKECLERKVALGALQVESILSAEHKKVASYILEKSGTLFSMAKKELEKPLLCKTCKKIRPEMACKKTVAEWNALRANFETVGACVSCITPFGRDSGCSVITCESCITHTKTCLVCMEGAALPIHDLQECTNRAEKADELGLLEKQEKTSPLPPIQMCECSLIEN